MNTSATPLTKGEMARMNDSAVGRIRALETALHVAAENSAMAGFPIQNWEQFAALLNSTGAFTVSQLQRLNRIYDQARASALKGQQPE